MSGRRLLDSLDFPTIITTLLLVAIGLFAIASATSEQFDREGLWRTQLIWLVVAAGAATVVVWVDYRLLAELAIALHGLVIVLLIAVLLVGTEVGGNRSWLVLGPLRAQPSEFAKWTTCLVLAVYLARRVRGSMGLRQLIEMSLLVALPVGLILLQPDMGTALIFLPISISALLIGGVRWKVLVGIAVIGLLLTPVAWTQLKGYQKERIMTASATRCASRRSPSGRVA
jgi:rod shape determining protein RodA